MQLQATQTNTWRRRAGRAVIASMALLAAGSALGVRAEQSASAPGYSVQMTLDANGEQSAPRVLARAGEQFAVGTGPWRVEMTVRPAKTAGQVWVNGKVLKAGAIVSAPALLVDLGKPAGIKVGDSDNAFAMSVLIGATASAVPAVPAVPAS